MKDVVDLMSRGGSDHSLFNLEGLVVRQSANAVLMFHDDSTQEVWIPKSAKVLKDWWFTSGGGKNGLCLEDLEKNDEVTLVISMWLAKRERLV